MTRATIRTILVAALVGAASPAALPAAPLSAGAYINAAGQLGVGDPVPMFHARDIYGTVICIEDLLRAGRKPMLAFWSMYCKACLEKFTSMIAIQKKYGHQGLLVISINTDGEYKRGEKAIREFIADFERRRGVKVNFPVLYDERNWVPQAMNIEFLPTIITVDPAGRVMEFYQSFGESSQEEILEGIAGLAQRQMDSFPAGAPPTAGPSRCPQKHE